MKRLFSSRNTALAGLIVAAAMSIGAFASMQTG
jgi:hypothetical protein